MSLHCLCSLGTDGQPDTSSTFATMSEESSAYSAPLPSGNASWTHSYLGFRFADQEKQKAAGIVAMSLSWPLQQSGGWGNSEPEEDFTADDVTIEMACLRVGSANGNGDEEDSASRTLTVYTSVIAIVLLLAMSLILA